MREGAGAFVCGEETALIASLEGERGMPRLRPPYPVEQGFRGRPTVINNVETLACVPWIVRHGPEAFAALGTESSKGTKVFALAGKVRHGGLIEVPMGVTVREIVEDLGGGVPKGRTLKAVQLGGPSGGCLPASLGETPVDYEALAETGAIMGSGGLVVLDDRDCMVEIARFFLRLHLSRVVRQVHVLPDRHDAHARDPRAAVRGRGPRRGPRRTSPSSPSACRAPACAGWGRPPRTRCSPRCATSARSSRPTFARSAARPGAAARSPTTASARPASAARCARRCVPSRAIEYRPHERHAIDLAACTRCNMCFEACEDGPSRWCRGRDLRHLATRGGESALTWAASR